MWYLNYHARRIIRNYMKPMDPDKAKKWLKRVRILYFVLGLSAFSISYLAYYKNKEKLDKIKELDPTPSHRVMRLRGDPGKVVISRYTIGQGMQYYEYDNEDYIKEYNEKVSNLDVFKNTEKSDSEA